MSVLGKFSFTIHTRQISWNNCTTGTKNNSRKSAYPAFKLEKYLRRVRIQPEAHRNISAKSTMLKNTEINLSTRGLTMRTRDHFAVMSALLNEDSRVQKDKESKAEAEARPSLSIRTENHQKFIWSDKKRNSAWFISLSHTSVERTERPQKSYDLTGLCEK